MIQYCCPIGGIPVLGRGNLHPLILFIGEAPGKEEAEQGKPFVGRAGKLLQSCMELAGIPQDKIYITNAVKCRPEKNRTPTDQEVSSCKPYLLREIELLKPRLIVCLGAVPTKALLGITTGITKIHGRMYMYQDIPVMATVHPAWVLRNLTEKPNLIYDLTRALDFVEGKIAPKKKYRTVLNLEDLRQMKAEVEAAEGLVAFDYESTGLSPQNDTVIGISFSAAPYTAWYVPLKDCLATPGRPQPFHIAGVQEEVEVVVNEILGNENICKVGHGVKFDCQLALSTGARVEGLVQDTYLTATLLDTNASGKGLADFSNLRPDLVGYKEKVDRAALWRLPIDQLADYGCSDSDLTLWLAQYFEPQVQEQGLQWLNSVYCPQASAFVADMEYRGAQIDVKYGKELERKFQGLLAEAQQQICDHVGYRLSSQSDVQIISYFRGQGVQLVDAKEATIAAVDLPISSLILRGRKLSKMTSTFVTGILSQADSQGRLHSKYSLDGAGTGRTSSAKPNLQNIPAREEEFAKAIKRMFVATPGYVIVCGDLSQAEYRLAAWYAQDQKILSAIDQGVDFHKFVASLIFGKPLEFVAPEERQLAKTINFAMLYGAGLATIARNAKISVGEARRVRDLYFENSPKFKAMIDRFHSQVREHGYVTSLLGRRFRFNMDDNKDGHVERDSVNYPIQGDSSCYALYQGGVQVHKEMTKQKIDHYPINFVHDALYYEVVDDPVVVDEATAIIREVGTQPLEAIRVRMDMDTHLGYSWDQL